VTGVQTCALPISVLTGTGNVDVVTILELDPFDIRPLASGPGGGEFPFAPDLITIEWESFQITVGVTYIYQNVPAPGSAALLSVGALATCRRRRRAIHAS